MAKWEYLRVSVWFTTSAIIRLTPKRESHAKLLASVGLKAVEKDPAPAAQTPTHDTITLVPWASSAEKFCALIDAATADGWEPFQVHEEDSIRVVHLRRQS